MSEQLIVAVILKLLDLGIRLSDKPQDVEEYARLRREVRKAVVAEANDPVGTEDDDEAERRQAEAGVEDELAADDEAVVEQNQESDDDEAQASTQPE